MISLLSCRALSAAYRASAAICTAVATLNADSAGAQARPQDGAMPFVSPDGKLVAFLSTRDGAPGVWVMNSDGSGAKKLVLWERPRHGAWTPDSRRLALFRADGDSAGVYVVDVPTGTVTRVVQEPGVRSVAWSPDGSRLVYGVARGADIALVTVEANGTNRTVITPGAGRYLGASWSPDGATIAVVKSGAGIWTMRSDGADARQVVPEGSSPAWSPDGRWIAYVATVMGAREPGQQWARPRRADIVLVRPDGSERRVLTTQAEDLVVETPSWFPDGRRLAVQLVRDGSTLLHVLDVPAGLLTPLPAK